MNLPRHTVWVLVWTILWFGWIVPAHPRGAVSLDGAAECRANGSCCNRAGSEPEKQDSDPKPNQSLRCCAICTWVARLDTAPRWLFVLPPAELIACIDLPGAGRLECLPIIGLCLSRAPPEDLFL